MIKPFIIALSIVLLFLCFSAQSQEITEYPYFTTFSSSNWTAEGWSTTGNDHWERSTSTGYQSGESMYYSSTSSGRYGYLYSPIFRFDNINDATLSLKYYAEGRDYSSKPTKFLIQIRINQGPWQSVFDYNFNLNELYWQGFEVQLSSYLPSTPEATILEVRAYCYHYLSSYHIDQVRIDHFEIKNVEYRPGYAPNDHTTQYGWEQVPEEGLTLPDGKIAIAANAVDPNHELWVNGSLKAKEVLISVDSVPDYVFEDDYDLLSLEEVDRYVKAEKHLPGVPSESEYKADGVDVGKLNMILLKKIEELTLHMIELKSELKKLKQYHTSGDAKDANNH